MSDYSIFMFYSFILVTFITTYLLQGSQKTRFNLN